MPRSPQHVPRATYRVQLHSDFTFANLTDVVPYLSALGISHVYCSPYLRARPGSRHGYDIIDHRTLNPEIGTPEDFARLVETLACHGMSHLCDVVPNHIAIMGDDNPWWMDVLENGPASAYAAFFDIDWAPRDPDLAGKVLVPVLGEPYGTVLERGELVLAFDVDAGAFAVRYFEHRFPLDPRTYAEILLAALPATRAKGAPRPVVAEFERIAYTFKALPARDEQAPARIHVRFRQASELKRDLARLVTAHPSLAEAIAGTVVRINGTLGDAPSFEALHALLDAQAFRLAHWRVASDEVNYRRFFDINGLAALRMENEAAFDATHEFILDLAADGIVGGLRIDHPDGLLDPAGYFARLQQRYRERSARRLVQGAAPMPEPPNEIYIVVEKITAPHERLPQQWPVRGTTGYRFANVVNGLFVDTKARARVDRTWRAFVGAEAHTFEEAAYRGRRVVMEGSLASQLNGIALRALRIARADRRTRDLTLNSLRTAIIEIVARFPVYRTYVDADGASEQDRRYVDWAVGRARARSRASDPVVFEFLWSIMLGARPDGAEEITEEACREFAMRFQQFTAPVTAKGVEDTAFYTFNRLVSLNEVGGDPDRFGITVRAFHAASADRAAQWPHTMLATSTHDTKRSEDVRARIDVISEMPAAWRLLVRRWSRMNRLRRREVDGEAAPSRNDEYLLYQTLAGSFPPGNPDDAAVDRYRERVQQYMTKAAREAKVRTSWLAVNEPYEEALTGFVADLLRTGGGNRFLDDLREHSATFAWFGMLNSLSVTLLKLASPGVPDIYQGNEILDGSLVDPDNRRPVDYDARRALLASLATLRAGAPGASRVRSLFESPYDGRAKLWVIAQALDLRRRHAGLFATGKYERVAVTGARENHVVAFRRAGAEGGPAGAQGGVLVVAGRLFASLGVPAGTLPLAERWGDTKIDASFLSRGTRVENVLTGEALVIDGDIEMATLFRDFPGALVHCVTGDAG
ncbi:MAG TPA: malto-oligosyltrehalose synthase [Casimicrobiaceae bacterium]|nr:malto-oligosyltrehalose synthase [Casimicrobiaceae bacterium]